jgi:phage-related minor tail protein
MKNVLLYIFLFTIIIYGQDTTKLFLKQSEFDKVKKEIRELENELKQKTQNEKKSLKTIENLNKQNLLLNKAITTLRVEEKKRGDEI